ncbi:hypothetical protein B9Q08_05070 [Candidatus Marsarchaeota G2 archaeon ECH_B_SAG-M15]|uniref:Leucyl aminopeptidase n=1 Tax=Candidatus Marsarchaeota G2 archaeon ECH_B_SAG-M15 TaxID=1978162 RepID=A0A2R6AV55_9ARCH|nr:MAG: hypothetical protein B9Q08_05070 [Candidatus Marsarchaeota G2 archaeon ECH_B_SAG-M15]
MSVDETNSSALTLLQTCLGIVGGETLLIVYDKEHRGVLKPIRDAAHITGVSRVNDLLYVDEQTLTGVLSSYEVVMFCVSDQLTLTLGHSDARLKACRNGSRIAFLTRPLESTPPTTEILRVARATNRLKNRLKGAVKLVVETDGVQLIVYVGGREPVALTSLITKPGSWGAIPDYAEVALAPIESSANGSFVADACVVGLGPLMERLTLRFENGCVRSAGGGLIGRNLSRILAREPGSNLLGEIGFGTNVMRKEFRGEFDDKKALGSVHLGLGDNHTIGGVNRSSVHLDCLAKTCKLSIDGVPFDFQSLYSAQVSGTSS